MKQDKDLHALSGYAQNVSTLLKYIKQDARIDNETTKEMLEIMLGKGDEIFKALDSLRLRLGEKK